MAKESPVVMEVNSTTGPGSDVEVLSGGTPNGPDDGASAGREVADTSLILKTNLKRTVGAAQRSCCPIRVLEIRITSWGYRCRSGSPVSNTVRPPYTLSAYCTLLGCNQLAEGNESHTGPGQGQHPIQSC